MRHHCSRIEDSIETYITLSYADIGGSNDKDTEPHSLANVPLKWMLKEIIAANTGLIFRRSALERAHIDIKELLEAAELTKIEDAKLKNGPTEDPAATLVNHAESSMPNVTLRVSTMDGGEAVPIPDADDGKALKEAEHLSLYNRWKATSSAMKDSLCHMTDQLVVKPAWWILEFLPFIDSNQDEHGHWRNSVR